MRFLDIDLDAFQHQVLHWRSPNSPRPSAAQVPAWTEDELRKFLEEGCGLSATAPVNGRLVTHHDELFDLWRSGLQRGELIAPFDVVHVDAHADLGFGDRGHAYLTTQWLHVPVGDRAAAVRPALGTGMGPGNYLAFAIGCRWLRSLTYVYPQGGGRDAPPRYFRDRDPKSGVIELPLYPPDTKFTPTCRRAEPIAVEPAVPYSAVRAVDFKTSESFDMACVSTSPEFTARATERLLPIIENYILLRPDDDLTNA